MAAGDLPKFVWGDALENTLLIGQPLDNVSAYEEPREGSDWAKVSSGVEDAWITGWDQFLAADWRWVPATDSADPPATGWDGSAGVRAFLRWMRDKNVARFHPDKSDDATYHEVYLVEPMRGEPPLEEDGSRKLRLVIRDKNDSPFTGY